MKRLLFILLFIPTLLVGQQPFYGNRSFISLDGNDTLNLRFSGDTIYFESTDSVYFDKLLNIGVIKGAMQIVKAEVLYTNTSQTTIVALPENAVVSRIDYEVVTAFDSGTSDLLDIGTTATPDLFFDDEIISSIFSTWEFFPGKFTSATNVTFTYTSSGTTPTQGQAFVYVYYTIF